MESLVGGGGRCLYCNASDTAGIFLWKPHLRATCTLLKVHSDIVSLPIDGLEFLSSRSNVAVQCPFYCLEGKKRRFTASTHIPLRANMPVQGLALIHNWGLNYYLPRSAKAALTGQTSRKTLKCNRQKKPNIMTTIKKKKNMACIRWLLMCADG